MGSLIGRRSFEACVRIIADFPQQWHQIDLPRSEPLLEIVAALFVDRVLTCLPSKIVTPSLKEKSVCVWMCVCEREREERKMCMCVYNVLTDIYMHAHNHSAGLAAVPCSHIGSMSGQKDPY